MESLTVLRCGDKFYAFITGVGRSIFIFINASSVISNRRLAGSRSLGHCKSDTHDALRPIIIDSKKQKPKIFIGSSLESLKYAQAIEARLRKVASVTIWKNERIWRPGLLILENLINLLPGHDFAVLILGAEDVINSRGRARPGPRDNIVFELGLFMGHLGRRRTFFLCRKDVDLKIPTDLVGITYIPFNGTPQAQRAVAGASRTILEEIKRQGVHEPSIKVSRHVGEAVFKWMDLSPSAREKLARSQLIKSGGTKQALMTLVKSANRNDSILAICGYKGDFSSAYYKANFRKCKTVSRVFSYEAISSEITLKKVRHALDGLKLHLDKLDKKPAGRCKIEVLFIPKDRFIRDLGGCFFDPPMSFGLTILRGGNKLKKAVVHWEMDAQLLRDLMAIEGIIIDDGQQDVLRELVNLWEDLADSDDVLSSKRSKTEKKRIAAFYTELEEMAVQSGCPSRERKA